MKLTLLIKNMLIAQLLLVIVGLSSCISIGGISNDYNKTTDEQKQLIHEYAGEEDRKTGHIYKINGQQLKNELRKHEKSLVYIFVSGCSSSSCLPLSVYQNYAKENDYKLFLIFQGYYELDASLKQDIGEAFLAIDNEFYGTKYMRKGKRFFMNDLLNRPKGFKEKVKEYKGSIYLFERDKLVSQSIMLPESKKVAFPIQQMQQ